MRFAKSAAVFVLLVATAAGHSRHRRFLNTDSLSLLPHSLVRLGDYARDLGDQLSSQASMAVQHMMPQSSRAAALRREQMEKTSKRAVLQVPAGRETEGDDVAPEETHKRPVESAEETWFRPLVPFSFSFGLLTPWWQGPNVCVEQDDVEEQELEQDFGGFNINFETTRCVPSDSSYVCTKKIQSNGLRKTSVLRRQCCHGFIRRQDGRPGCAALRMENVLETLRVLEMDRFAGWVDGSGLGETLSSNNYTLFAPSNSAIADYEDDTEDNEISAIASARHPAGDVPVRGHVVLGFVNVDHVEDEHLMDTLNGDVKIRINKYQQVATANCIPLTGRNNFATNGIVHLVSGVLPQPTRSLADIINEESQFSTLKKLLLQSGLLEDLEKPGQPWTLFAPTDDAFRKLPRSLKNQMESGEACVENILRQHMVRGTLCTSSVVRQTQVKNILTNVLHVTRDEAEKVRVEGALVHLENNLATNGVLHSVAKVLIPPQAKSLLKSLEEQERTDILQLIETANLTSSLEDMKNITLFVPSKEAMQNLPNETLQAMESDPDLAKRILYSHLIASHIPTSEFADNKNLETLQGHSLHMKLQELFPGIITGATVQCAHITSHDHHMCGAVMHSINKVLMPPEGSIVEILKGMEGHDIVLRMLQGTEIEKILEEKGPFTFLAPSDDAFERMMSDTNLKEMMENKTKAEEILKLHILPEKLCCNGISHITPFHRQFVRTLDGSILPLQRNLYDRVKFGRARALQCDLPASNGLIHSISRMILPQRPPMIQLFGI